MPRRGLIAALLLFAAAGPPGGCAAAPPPLPPEAGPRTHAVHLVARGWQTEIGIPVHDGLEGPLAPLAAERPEARFLLFGFGERNYLLSRDPSPGDMLMALLPGRPAAVMLSGIRTAPAAVFGAEEVVVLPVSRAGRERLERFLAGSFDLDAAGRPHRLAAGAWPASALYAASAPYSATYTCNTWTADALAQAGLPVSASGVLFASQVMAQGRRAARTLGAPALAAAE